jgi:uncharacterized membrane protein YkoI
VKRTLLIAGLALAIAGTAQAQAPKSAAASKPHKYKKVMPKALVKEARITEPQAADVAMKAVPGATIDRMELEKENGTLIYSYDLKTKGKEGVDEVHVDATSGVVVSNVHETAAQEKAERKSEGKKPSGKKPPTNKKP